MLAAGRGTRMQLGTDSAQLTPVQRAAAELGLKALIPFHGEPFLSYVLTALADAGITHVCLVVGPGEHPVRTYFSASQPRRLELEFGVQTNPLGSAHALLAAERCTRGHDFILINADNDYPMAAFAALRTLGGPGLIGFRSAGLQRGNVTPDRLAAYAVLDVAADGMLRRVREKPAPEAVTPDVLISMTCWRFDARIFDACRSVGLSVRGEYELPDAVNVAIHDLDVHFQVVPMDAPVLDLSRPEDAATVATFLRGRRINL